MASGQFGKASEFQSGRKNAKSKSVYTSIPRISKGQNRPEEELNKTQANRLGISLQMAGVSAKEVDSFYEEALKFPQLRFMNMDLLAITFIFMQRYGIRRKEDIKKEQFTEDPSVLFSKILVKVPQKGEAQSSEKRGENEGSEREPEGPEEGVGVYGSRLKLDLYKYIRYVLQQRTGEE